ncbi:hypothetical protein HYH03_013753 [Edaphochlamys debaryana]|uniref:Uncharacterized protein n=1 Tax=Edaphochlamys debaryana TaxID=47281 RepID=A0A836BU73_9CHLO|nr:hypothetical protein HYH03_013753 [Edaphochlamys debaryana]|eukprot:KAG2487614.1 hypothetical protein HYH03_013753 [Edaphochlamys debaryana]
MGGGLINLVNDKPVHLVLAKDRVRSVKRGHPWIFPEVLRELPRAPAGSLALLKTADGDIIAKGFYDPGSKLAFRALAVERDRLDDSLVSARLGRAMELRAALFAPYDATSGFRLVNGEGDGLPGLVVDVYAGAAVMKLDGAGAESFYNADALASWLMAQRPSLRTVFLKYRAGGGGGGAGGARGEERGRPLAGVAPKAGEPVRFVENGVNFQADIVQGQKTGFFLDQRENRAFIRQMSRGKRVLNVFGYTGGFSVYAGVGGAAHVTTVDVGRAALSYAEANWELNGLPRGQHAAEAEDAFAFLERASKAKEKWDVVIIDPPSFAPNKASVPAAKASYTRLFAAAAAVTAPHGCLSLASCSSHIDSAMFMEFCEEALGKARRRGYVLRVAGQPPDHPFPAAAEELRYLKFVTYRLEG